MWEWTSHTRIEHFTNKISNFLCIDFGQSLHLFLFESLVVFSSLYLSTVSKIAYCLRRYYIWQGIYWPLKSMHMCSMKAIWTYYSHTWWRCHVFYGISWVSSMTFMSLLCGRYIVKHPLNLCWNVGGSSRSSSYFSPMNTANWDKLLI